VGTISQRLGEIPYICENCFNWTTKIGKKTLSIL